MQRQKKASGSAEGLEGGSLLQSAFQMGDFSLLNFPQYVNLLA